MLELRKAVLDEKYRKKWNETSNDFVHLYKDGVKLRNTLYRLGGFYTPNFNNNYIMLLKHVEAFYDDSIIKVKKDKPHLESQACIIDINGVEKVNFTVFDSPYLTGGIVYSIKNNFYNIETGEFYGWSNTSFKSRDYIFIDNAYDKDESKRGILKINKNDGSKELFK